MRAHPRSQSGSSPCHPSWPETPRGDLPGAAFPDGCGTVRAPRRRCSSMTQPARCRAHAVVSASFCTVLEGLSRCIALSELDAIETIVTDHATPQCVVEIEYPGSSTGSCRATQQSSGRRDPHSAVAARSHIHGEGQLQARFHCAGECQWASPTVSASAAISSRISGRPAHAVDDRTIECIHHVASRAGQHTIRNFAEQAFREWRDCLHDRDRPAVEDAIPVVSLSAVRARRRCLPVQRRDRRVRTIEVEPTMIERDEHGIGAGAD